MRALLIRPRRAPARGVLLVVIAIAVCACGSKTESTAPGGSADPAAGQIPAEMAPVVPAPAVTQASWAPDALEELLAPIALYPDQLLGQILAASVNSQEVLDAGNWLLQNENLKGNELDAAAQKAGFGPAMRSLVQFPTVVDMMCQQIDWTRQVGSAFSSDQAAVLDAVQRLRLQAQETGNLKSTKEQTVETKTENDKVVVEVKPADPQIVYVPTYNPQTVYTTPPPPPTTVVVQEEDTVSTGAAVAGGLIAFGLGVIIGNEMNDDYYPHWGYGSVYYGPRPFYPPAYVYRPVYGPAFRPAYGYASPPGYRHNYNNVNIGNDVNINIDNDYFNRFDNNQNLRAGHTSSPMRPTQQPRAGQTGGAQRVGQASGSQRIAQPNTAESWKGQSTYQGAKNTATADRLNQAAGGRVGADQSREIGTAGETRSNPALAQTQQREQIARTQHADRGYGASTRTEAREHAPSRDMGGATAAQRPATQHAGAPERRDNAFSGAQRGSGSFDRAASTRGNASAGHARSGGGRRR